MSKPRILIVEDEEDNLESLKGVLQDENPDWEILTARDPDTGKKILEDEMAKKEPIDVVLTDLLLPSEPLGMDLLRDARSIDPLVMVILFTAKEESLDRYAALGFGAFDVVEKSIRGTEAFKEISLKTRAALQHGGKSKRVAFLRRYFDPTMFDRIEQDHSVLSLKEQALTICFWDIRGFSKLCEILKAKPSLISGFLQGYFEIAAKTIFEFGGLLDKFIGDGVMALFGALDDKGDGGVADARVAVRCALALEPRFEDLHNVWISKWRLDTAQDISIGLGCGIHTGDTLVGNVGTEFRDQFTALGPNVNLAARIEHEAEKGQILLSRTTNDRVSSVIKTSLVKKINNVHNIAGDYELFAAEYEKTQ